ncbi:Transcription factor bHLH123 [Linum perenne]
MMMPCLENSIPMDSIRFQNLEAEATSFCWDSIAFSDYQLDHLQTPAPGFHITPPETSFFTSYDQQISAGSEYVSFCSSSDTISSQSSTPLVVENVIHSRQVRKRPTEVSNSSIAMKGGKRKRSSDTFVADTWHHQQQMDDQSITLQEIKGFQVPMRRSQKMSDKITALQKLVSPYGKTDTASVLQEASLCIKLLHKHIQMLIHSDASSPADDSQHTTLEESDGEVMDLRSRGLCLVPLSLTKKIAEKGLVLDSYLEE